jgi:hypothetical protein
MYLHSQSRWTSWLKVTVKYEICFEICDIQGNDRHNETKYCSSVCYSVITDRPTEFVKPKKINLVSAKLF